jgi:hypothetical protein
LNNNFIIFTFIINTFGFTNEIKALDIILSLKLEFFVVFFIEKSLYKLISFNVLYTIYLY